MHKNIFIQYYAILREQTGKSEEIHGTLAQNAVELFLELKERYGFFLNPENCKVAINDEFKDWQTALEDQDRIIFIPPVAGG